ncbi:hypothetical protein SAY87_011505 [Trapa incisa]|uniref:Late embryogenesis abundant protein LEA-2 subgroup domain-containing protein n=1 Tax=Trapa incisa TaxID=236973 RepID=A0AAN7JJ96_9MYRT|nr:hypothetical protein SAY87_011505 [Trapa incisa]
MAERVTATITIPPADRPNKPDPHGGQPTKPLGQDVVAAAHYSFPSGTYVVQVPKDQIYRVPPAHNAQIAELHKNHHTQTSKRSGYCRCFLCIFLLLIIVLIVIGITVGISILTAKPKNPEFRLHRFTVRNSTGSLGYDYDIRMEAYDPDGKTGVVYNEGGVASLHFKGSTQSEIARGKYPSVQQGEKDTHLVSTVLKGSSSQLPEQMKNSFKAEKKKKIHVSFVLNISVQVRMKFGFFKEEEKDIDVACNFTVDTLAQGTRVLSQSCQTTGHGQ